MTADAELTLGAGQPAERNSQLPAPKADENSRLGRVPRGMLRLGILATYLACLTTPWTAIGFGPVRLGDIFLAMAVALLLLGDVNVRQPRLPGWIWALAISVLLVGAIHAFMPTSPLYLSQRLFPLTTGEVLRGAPAQFSNLSVMVKFLVAVVGLPLVFGLAYMHDDRFLRRGALTFATGSAISGLLAFTDVQGLTSISSQLTGIAVSQDRGSGLTDHPNFVALGCVFGLPFMLWQMLAPNGRDRALSILGATALLLGVYASGSRSGGGAGAAAVLLSFLVIPRFRRVLPTVALLSATVLTAVFVTYPTLGEGVLRALRLTGTDAAGSDLARTIVNEQGIRDFQHSPIFGVGLQVGGEAHIVYLQALAAGGVVLLFGYTTYLLGALIRSYGSFNIESVAAPLFVAILGGTIFNAAQDVLTLRIVYVPAALAAILPLQARRGPSYDERVQ